MSNNNKEQNKQEKVLKNSNSEVEKIETEEVDEVVVSKKAEKKARKKAAKEAKRERKQKNKRAKKRVKIMRKYFRKKYGKTNSKANDFITEDIDNAILRAKLLLNVEEDNLSEPLIIRTPLNIDENNKVKYRISTNKKDTHVDYENSLITSIYLSNESLYYHKTSINHLTGLISSDVAGELNLFDILHIETVINQEQMGNYKIMKAYLKLNLVDGKNMVFNLKKHFIYDNVQLDNLLGENETYIVKTIKQAVRLSK